MVKGSESSSERLVPLGRLGKPYQLAGGLRFYPLGPAEAEALSGLAEVVVAGLGPCRVREVRPHGGGLVLYLTLALSREAARTLVNREILAPASRLPETAPYLDDLVGLPVYLDGDLWGEVKGLMPAGLQDLLIIARVGREAMVPLQAPYLRLDGEGVFLEDAPEGLLEL